MRSLLRYLTGEVYKWEDMVAVQEVGALTEAVAREAQAVRAVAVPERRRHANHLPVAITAHITIEKADYIVAIRVMQVLEPRVPGMVESYSHWFLLRSIC